MNTIYDLLNRWFSKNGDTSFWSWVITFAYLVVIILALLYRKKIKADKPRYLLWSAIFFFVLAMGINKQLDFQTLLVMSGRWVAKRLDFLEHRRHFLRYSALFLALLVSASTILLLIKTRSVLSKEKTALGGTAILMLFALVRMGTISHIKQAMILEYIVRHVHALELLGLLVILISLLMNLNKMKRASAT